jgi:hypothetical protein
MNTKDVILVVAGVAVGYLLAGYLKKSKDSSTTGSTGSTNSPEPTVDQAKIDACNKEVADFMKTARFSAGVMEKKKKEIFDACMAKNA